MSFKGFRGSGAVRNVSTLRHRRSTAPLERPKPVSRCPKPVSRRPKLAARCLLPAALSPRRSPAWQRFAGRPVRGHPSACLAEASGHDLKAESISQDCPDCLPCSARCLTPKTRRSVSCHLDASVLRLGVLCGRRYLLTGSRSSSWRARGKNGSWQLPGRLVSRIDC